MRRILPYLSPISRIRPTGHIRHINTLLRYLRKYHRKLHPRPYRIHPRKIVATAIALALIFNISLPLASVLFESLQTSVTADYDSIRATSNSKYLYEASNQDLKAYFGDKRFPDAHRFSIEKLGATFDLRLTEGETKCPLNTDNCSPVEDNLRASLTKTSVIDFESIAGISEEAANLARNLESELEDLNQNSANTHSEESVIRQAKLINGSPDSVTFLRSEDNKDVTIDYEIIDKGVRQTIFLDKNSHPTHQFLLNMEGLRAVKLSDSQYVLLNTEQTVAIQINKPTVIDSRGQKGKAALNIYTEPRGIILEIGVDKDYFVEENRNFPLMLETSFVIGGDSQRLAKINELINKVSPSKVSTLKLINSNNSDALYQSLNQNFQVSFGSKQRGKTTLAYSSSEAGGGGIEMQLIDESKNVSVRKNTKLEDEDKLESEVAVLSGASPTLLSNYSSSEARSQNDSSSQAEPSNNNSHTLVESVEAQNVKEGVNIEYKVFPQGVKENIVLTKKPSSVIPASEPESIQNGSRVKPGMTAQLTFNYALKAVGVVPLKNSDGVWEFFKQSSVISRQSSDKNNKSEDLSLKADSLPLFHIPLPYAIDANGNITTDVKLDITPGKDCGKHFRKYDQSHGCYLVTLSVDQSWLQDSVRAYPVYIDPSITDDTSAEFAIDTTSESPSLNRVFDTGSGASPVLETYYQEMPADINTVGLWHMNENATGSCTGGTNDVCNNADPGTNDGNFVGNAAFTTSSRLGTSAVLMDGNGDYIDVVDNAALDLTTSYTLEAWVKPASATESNDKFIIYKRDSGGANGYYMYFDDPSNTFKIGQASSSSSCLLDGASVFDSLDTSKWYHIAGTFSGRMFSLYIDGRLDKTQTCSIDAGANTETLNIGGRDDSATENWNGTIDEVRISNMARSSEEIKMDALRRPYSTFTSQVFDLTANISQLQGLSWSENAVRTGDGETLSDSTSLVAQWNFNDNPNGVSDTTANADAGSCGSSCNGTLTDFDNTTDRDADPDSGWTANNRRWGSGALQFDGTNSRVDVSDTSGIDNFTAYSQEIWVKTSVKPSALKSIFSKHNGSTAAGSSYFTGITTSGFFYTEVNVSTTTYSATSKTYIPDGNWHHLVITYDGSNIKMYVDGILQATTAATGTVNNTTTALRFGAYGDTPVAFFTGVIDSARLYSRALTLNEITSNYNHTNLELQTRTGTTTTPNDGTWEDWKPNSGSNESELGSEGDMDGPFQYSTSETGLTAYYPMDEATDNSCSGGTNDVCDKESTTAADGADSGGSKITDGKFGKARGFDGTDDFIELTENASTDLTSNLTLEGWVKVSSLASIMTFTGRRATTNSAWNVEIRTDGVVRFEVYDGAGGSDTTDSASGAITVGTWNHIAVVYNPSTSITIYINGQQNGQSTSSIISSLRDTGNGPAIGRFGGSSSSVTQYFNGDIDEFRIYSSSLSAATIQQHFLEGSSQISGNSISNSTDFTLAGNLGIGVTSQKTAIGAPKVDSKTVGLWHLDETNSIGPVYDAAGYRSFTKDTNGTLEQGLSAYWKLDEGSATTASDSISKYDLSQTSTTVVTGKLGSARDFATSAYLACSDANCGGKGRLDFHGVANQGMSWQAWIKTSSSSQQMIISKDDDTSGARAFNIYSESSNLKVDIFKTDGGFSQQTGGGVANGQWRHIVVTYQYVADGSSILTLYIDGSQSAQKTNTVGPIQEGAAEFSIGRREYNAANAYFTGSIDEVGVWQRALSATEVSDLYNSTSANFLTSTTSNIGIPTSSDPPSVINSPFGKGRDFNGSNEISLGTGFASTFNSSPVVTYEAWIKRDSTTGNQELLSDNGAGGGMILYFYGSDNRLAFGRNGGSECSAGASYLTDTTQWYHIALTYDGTTCTFYKNGVATTSNVSVTFDSGKTYSLGDESYDGKMDEVRISNVVRTQKEIQEAYRAGRDHRIGRAITSDDLSSSTLVPFYIAADRPGTYLEATIGESAFANNEADAESDGLWHLEEPDHNLIGSYLVDSSGKGNHAGVTVQGAATVQGKIGKGRSFDGSDDYITTTDVADWDLGSSNFTVDWWEYRRDDTDGCAICREGTVAATAFIFGYSDASGTIKAYGSTNGSTFDMFTGQSMGPYVASQWVHRAITRSSTTCKTFMNGVEMNSFTCSGSFVASANPLSFGRYNTSNYANLILDEVSFINGTAKSADEIRQKHELSRRTHPITIDFASSLQAAYTTSSGTSMTINNNSGQTNLTDSLKVGDTIIVQENVGGTEYRAVAVVSAITNTSSVYGTVTLAADISDTYLPTGGFTTSARVFKWQREYFDLSGVSFSTHKDAVTRLTIRVTDGSQGANIWLDDFKVASYLSTSGNSPSSGAKRYYQYRVIQSSADPGVSSNFTAVTQNYKIGPRNEQIMRHGAWWNAEGIAQPFWWSQ